MKDNAEMKIKFNLEFFLSLIGTIIIAWFCYRFNLLSAEKGEGRELVIIKSAASFVAVILLVTSLIAWMSEHIPKIRITGGRCNEGKDLVYFEYKNYSRTLIKDLLVRYALFDCSIKDGQLATNNDVNLSMVSLKHNSVSSLGPDSTDEIVINFNRTRTELKAGKLTLDLYAHHVFLLIWAEFGIPFLPFIIKMQKGLLYYSRQHNEWFVGSEQHPEMKRIFSDVFNYLKKNSDKELCEYLTAGKRRSSTINP